MIEEMQPNTRWPNPTATELRRLPAVERDAILAAQASEAEHEYRSNPDLMAFEALGAEDGPLDDHRPTESR